MKNGRIDMTGQKFGRLTVIEYAYSDKEKKAVWLCRCDCGNTCYARGKSLRTGVKQSCGCYQRERTREASVKHGGCGTKLRNSWKAMKARCYDPNSYGFPWYGGRGITVCDEWLHSFGAFRDWALANGYREGLSIDRIDADGNYEPSNCRWISKSENSGRANRNRKPRN